MMIGSRLGRTLKNSDIPLEWSNISVVAVGVVVAAVEQIPLTPHESFLSKYRGLGFYCPHDSIRLRNPQHVYNSSG